MKRPFNIFDALFMMALVFKLTGTGLQVAWWELFTPYAIEGLFAIIGAIATLFSWRERVKFWFWKLAMNFRVRQAGANAKAYMDGIQKAHDNFLKAKQASSNPGQFIDPADLGKK
jgi:hypothetical protein